MMLLMMLTVKIKLSEKTDMPQPFKPLYDSHCSSSLANPNSDLENGIKVTQTYLNLYCVLHDCMIYQKPVGRF